MSLEWSLTRVTPSNFSPCKGEPVFESQGDPEEIDLVLTGQRFEGPIVKGFFSNPLRLAESPTSSIFPAEVVRTHLRDIEQAVFVSEDIVTTAMAAHLMPNTGHAYYRDTVRFASAYLDFIRESVSQGCALRLDVTS